MKCLTSSLLETSQTDMWRGLHLCRGLYLWNVVHLFCICYLIPNTVGNPDNNSGSDLSKLCSPGPCRNGQCYTVGNTERCYCPARFHGSRCEHVDLDQVMFSVLGSVVVFRWEHPPRLNGYSFVYYELDNPNSYKYKTDIIMKDNENAALVGNLKGGYTLYRICIEDELLADKVVNQDAVEYLTNCVNLTTEPDYHTLVAWCIAAMLAAVAVLFIYFQRDKLELLYFSKPAFLIPKPPGTYIVKKKQESIIGSVQTNDSTSLPVCNHTA